MSGVIILVCVVCGAEVQENEQQCSNCTKVEDKVQVLTSEEKKEFTGITLVQDEERGSRHYDSANDTSNQRIYSKQFNLVNTGLLTKVLFAVVILGIVFVALPIAILAISIVSVMIYLFRK